MTEDTQKTAEATGTEIEVKPLAEVTSEEQEADARLAEYEELVGDVDLVLSGNTVEIDVPNPFNENASWYMKQPTDIAYEMAQVVRASVKARILNDPEVIPAKDLPPSKAWVESQIAASEQADAMLAVIRNRDDSTKNSFDNVMIGIWESYKENLETADEYNLAEELADKAASRSFQAYLIPRLLVDENGILLIDVSTPEGEAAWSTVDRMTKNRLRVHFMRLLNLLRVAKNL